jgi:hypothetical protein
MRDLNMTLINLIGSLIFLQMFLPRPPRWARIALAAVAIPTCVFLLVTPITVPIDRNLGFALTLGSVALLLGVCITALVRRPWDRRARAE